MAENSEDDKRRVKLVVVGDGAVGKTCLLATFSTGDFPAEYVPTVFDNQIVEKDFRGEPILLQLWDTAGQEDYDRLRPLSYPGSDIVLLCYSTVSEASYEAISEKWIEEVQEYIEDVPVFLVGTKTDMREDKIADIVEESFTPVSTEMGEELAEEIGAKKFIETSAKTGHNLKELFEQAIELAMAYKFPDSVTDNKKKESSKKEEPKKEEPKKEEKKVEPKKEEPKKKEDKKSNSEEKKSETKKEDKKSKSRRESKRESKKKEEKKEEKKDDDKKKKKKKWWNR